MAFIFAGLALTVALITWFKMQQSPAGDGTPAPTQTAGQPSIAEVKVTDLTDPSVRDLTPDGAPPEVPYMIDLNTGEMMPLADAIIRLLATDRFDSSRFAASPDGSSLAFVGESKDGSLQIFTADLDGTGIRQVTHDPNGAMSPAWSPDGTKIAYDGYAGGRGARVFVLDLATEVPRQITFDASPCLRCPLGPQFTPDGSSIIYTDGTGSTTVVRSVPVAGGRSTILLGPGEDARGRLDGLNHWGNASVSPDGSLVTFVGSGDVSETFSEGLSRHCDRCRFVADIDVSDARIISGWTATPSGAWSPDGTLIVLARDPEPPSPIMVVNAATGEASMVAEAPATAAIWLSNHTLLVDRQTKT